MDAAADADMKKAYAAMLKQRERAKRNYEANRQAILARRKAKREEGGARRPRGRPPKEESSPK